jgi:hypothetical protein
MTLTSTDTSPGDSTSLKRDESDDDAEEKGDGIFSSKSQSEPTESQIRWIDPVEERERQKLVARDKSYKTFFASSLTLLPELCDIREAQQYLLGQTLKLILHVISVKCKCLDHFPGWLCWPEGMNKDATV